MNDLLHTAMAHVGVALTAQQCDRFLRYHALLVEWNEKMNLTAITEAQEVFEKHFADSLIAAAHIKPGAKVIDVGTGAGFPGVPLLILRPDIELTLLDSLKKRLTFLDAVCRELGLQAELVHARAEDGGRRPELRDRFDCAVSRAVAALPVLTELVMPFVKPGGLGLCYKGPALKEEAEQSDRALKALCSRLKAVESVTLPWGERTVAVLQKTAATPRAYPRKAGTPAKQPLI